MATDTSVCLHISNLSADSDHRNLQEEFQKYGKVEKVFYRPGNRYAKIVYSTLEEAEAVIRLSKDMPWRAEPARASSQQVQSSRPPRDKSRTRVNTYSSHSRENFRNSQEFPSSTASVDGDIINSEEIEDLRAAGATKSDDYVDVNGKPLTVWKLPRSGEILISLTEIKKAGFAVFHKDKFNPILKDEDQISHEFYLHLLGVAKTFLLKKEITHIDENKIIDVIEKVKAQLLDNSRSENSSQAFDTNRKSTSSYENNTNFSSSQNRNKHINSTSVNSDTSSQLRNKFSNYNNEEPSKLQQQKGGGYRQQNNRPQNNNYMQQNDTHRQQNDNKQQNDNYRQQNDIKKQQNFRQNNFKQQSNEKLNTESESRSPFIKNRVLKASDNNTIRIESTCSDLNTSGEKSSVLRPPKHFIKSTENELNKSTTEKENMLDQKAKMCQDESLNSKSAESMGKPSASSSPQKPPELRKPHTLTTELKNQEDLPKGASKKPPLKRVELKSDFQNVGVCHIEKDKPKTFWVCLQSNAEILESMMLDIIDCEPDSKIVDAVVGEIFLAQFDGDWYRAQVLETKPIKVFFIDYGNTAEVEHVKSIPKALLEIPAQAIKVELDDLCGKTLCSEMDLRIKSVEKIGDGEYIATMKDKPDAPVKKDKPDAPVKKDKADVPAKKDKADVPVKIPKKTYPVYCGKPGLLKPLKVGDMVMIIGEKDGKLYVRTKECCMKLKEINEEIKNFIGEPLSDLKVDQMVLATHNNEIRRAIVTNLSPDVEVEYIDYPGTETVSRDKIRSISESLAKQPVTLILTPKLNGVEQFKEKSSELLRQTIESKSKLAVEISDDFFDLVFSNKESLATKARQLDKEQCADGRVKYDDMEFYAAKIGVSMYMFFSVNAADDLTIIPTVDVTEWLEKLNEIADEDVGKEPYEPEELEMCLGDYDGSWYRCVIQSKLTGGNYDVMFVDYGNIERLHSSKLRKLTPDLASIPVLGVPCVLDNIPHGNEHIDMKLKELVKDGDLHNVHVKSSSGYRYSISVPFITQKFEELGFL